MKNRLAPAAIVAASALALAACSGSTSEDETTAAGTTAAAGEVTTLTIGATPVPHAEILAYVDENLAAGAGIDLENPPQRGVVGHLPGLGLDEVDVPGVHDPQIGRHCAQTRFKPFAAERRQGLLALEDDHVRGNRVSGPAIVANGRHRRPAGGCLQRDGAPQRLPPPSASSRCNADSRASGGM